MKTTLTSTIGVMVLCGAADAALLASDNASNYASFTDGSNGGSGFLAWSFNDNNNGTDTFAGAFLGDSTAGAGNINTGGQSFGLYANPGSAFVTVSRGFDGTMSVGDTFSFDMAVNFDNGNKGFNLLAGTQGEVFNFNVGSGGSVSSNNATLNPGSGAGYDYGGNDAVIAVSITKASSSSFDYSVSRTSSQGNQGTLFSGTVSGLTDELSGFAFYNSGTENGAAQNNLYFNNLAVVPEPSTVGLLGLGVLALAARRRR